MRDRRLKVKHARRIVRKVLSVIWEKQAITGQDGEFCDGHARSVPLGLTLNGTQHKGHSTGSTADGASAGTAGPVRSGRPVRRSMVNSATESDN